MYINTRSNSLLLRILLIVIEFIHFIWKAWRQFADDSARLEGNKRGGLFRAVFWLYFGALLGWSHKFRRCHIGFDWHETGEGKVLWLLWEILKFLVWKKLFIDDSDRKLKINSISMCFLCNFAVQFAVNEFLELLNSKLNRF